MEQVHWDDKIRFLSGGVMKLKRCIDCEYCSPKYHENMCARYPEWVGIYRPDLHWCGEWKEREDQEEEGN